MSQPLEALAKANEIRLARSAERAQLREVGIDAVVLAVVDPSPEFATYRLRDIFAPTKRRGVLERFSVDRLERVLSDLNRAYPVGRRWQPDLRLRDLNQKERARLAAAVKRRAPAVLRRAA